MKKSEYKNYDNLPLFLNATTVAQVLGISAASSYELMHEKDFPVLKVGSRWSYRRKSLLLGWSRTPVEVAHDESI